MVVQGTYAGFRLIDVTYPSRPKEIVNWTQCASPTNTVGNQGDVIVWGDLVIRAWNSGTPAPVYPVGHPMAGQTIPVTDPARFTTPGAFCGDWPMFREPADPATGLAERGQEGVHIIDISDPKNPDTVAFVDTPCGSHTETLVPDLANNRLLVYGNSSSGNVFGDPPGDPPPLSCARLSTSSRFRWPIPAAASYVRFEAAGDPSMPPGTDHHPCHDTVGVPRRREPRRLRRRRLRTSQARASPCITTDPAQGGSLTDPKFLYHKTTGGSGIGHSATFTYDGKIIVVGHEQGGGSGAECDALDPIVERTFFFLDAATGDIVGSEPRSRGSRPTWRTASTHNFNTVPLKNKNGKPRYVLVSGNYQSGISVIDFSDPANAKRSRTRIRRRSSTRTRPSASSSAATGRATGTTDGSTSPTSRGACSSGASTTRLWTRTCGPRARTTRRRSCSRSTSKPRSLAKLEREAAARRPPSS